MNSLSTEVPNSLNKAAFIRHPGFEKEVKKFSRKTTAFNEALATLERLLAVQFNPISPQIVITPKNLHRIAFSAEYELWKVNCVATKGLRKSQMPRIYFARRGAEIFFLCMGTHIDNYDDGELKAIALSRIQTFLG
ncbi:MAG TPA: hypothetical protein VJI96_03005 [Candidatus Andersenbacteria bacterium]|nr:hypothetical protein [Candidatus Andersenbacteria bacterium]